MNLNNNASSDSLETAIREHLDSKAATIDGTEFLECLKTRQNSTALRPSRLRAVLIRGTAGLALAASLLLALLFSNPFFSQELSAQELVQQARTTHSNPAVDYCYEISAEWNLPFFRRLNLEPISRKSKLWTRGDQFYLETTTPDGRTVVWGQDSAGRVWIALNPRRGLIYEPDELGEPLAHHCELMSLRLASTLSEMLERFDLIRVPSSSHPHETVIEASLRPGSVSKNPRFNDGQLVIDARTQVIKRVRLQRLVNDEVAGALTFDLIEQATIPDNRYRLDGHLEDGAIILDRPSTAAKKNRPWFDPRAKFRDEFLKKFQSRFKN